MAIQDKATYIAQKNIDFANNTSQLITPTIQRTDRQNLAESLAWLSDTNTYTGQQRFNKGADVASATVLPLIEDGNYFDVTGTVTVTSFADLGGAGTVIILQFDAACILTHHATDLILPTGGNITTAAGDNAIFVNYAIGDYRCLSYQRADGTALVAGGVEKVGTPVNNQVAVWTDDNTIEGDSKLTFDGTTLGVTGAATFAGAVTITGANALRGSYGAGGLASNFAAGDLALNNNTTGSTNTAIGAGALTSNTEGIKNTATGNTALTMNTTGSSNTATGNNALEANTIGDNNTAYGQAALSDNTVGASNTAIGFEALKDNTVGVSNTANGSSALKDNTTGSFNTAIGYDSGIGITTGSGNTVLGANVTGLTAGLTNNIILANGTGAIKAQHDGTNWSLTGFVGIGTTSPSDYLHVVGACRVEGLLKLNSSITNGTYVYSLPSATGTLALTSDLTGYLPLTGGTLTGALSGTSATFSGSVTAGSTNNAGGDNILSIANGGGTLYTTRSIIRSTVSGIGAELRTVYGTNAAYLGTTTSSDLYLITNNTTRLTISSTGAATFSGSVNVVNSTDFGNDSTYSNSILSIGNPSYPASIRSYRYGGSYLNGLDFYYNDGTSKLGMRITSGGNVGIGTASPNEKLQVEDGSISTYHNINANDAGYGIQFYTNGGGSKNSIAYIGISQVGTARSGDMFFQTSNAGVPTTKLTIASTGAATFSSTLSVNTTNAVSVLEIGAVESTGTGSTNAVRIQSKTGASNQQLLVGVNQTGLYSYLQSSQVSVGYKSLALNPNGGNVLVGGTTTVGYKFHVYGDSAFERTGTTSQAMVAFRNGNGVVGSISTSGSSTAYNTSSDYRLKENIIPITDALSRLNQLKPSRFNFISNADRTVDGFIAHEVQEIIPEAICGEKDAMMDEEFELTPRVEEVIDEDGNVTTEAVEAVMETRSVPDYQGIDQSKIVPLLVAAIQEQQAIIEDLKTRIEQLEL